MGLSRVLGDIKVFRGEKLKSEIHLQIYQENEKKKSLMSTQESEREWNYIASNVTNG